jgi:hypothetical protein
VENSASKVMLAVLVLYAPQKKAMNNVPRCLRVYQAFFPGILESVSSLCLSSWEQWSAQVAVNDFLPIGQTQGFPCSCPDGSHLCPSVAHRRAGEEGMVRILNDIPVAKKADA